MTTTRIIELRSLSATLEGATLQQRAADLWAIAREAESAGVSPTLVDVLLDDAAPDVARMRALAVIGSRLEREHAAVASAPQSIGALALSLR